MERFQAFQPRNGTKKRRSGERRSSADGAPRGSSRCRRRARSCAGSAVRRTGSRARRGSAGTWCRWGRGARGSSEGTVTKNRPRSGSSDSSRRASSSRSSTCSNMWVQITDRGLAALQPGEVGIVEHVADQVDPLGGLEVGMDDPHAASLQGAEHQLVDVGLLDLAEMLGGGAEVEDRRQLLRAQRRQRTAEPFGIAAHHVGWRALAAGTGGSPGISETASVVPVTVSITKRQPASGRRSHMSPQARFR